MASSPIKTSPGRLRMKCMLWEPDPISVRPTQDYTVVYNSTTLNRLPESIQRSVKCLNSAPHGLQLKEKYVYRDTFLLIGNEALNSSRADMMAENGERLYDDLGVPRFHYIEHQSFFLNGSLFSGNIVTPTGIRDGTVEALNNGLSKWQYEETPVPFESDGHESSDLSNRHDIVATSGGNLRTSDAQFEQKLYASENGLSDEMKGYIIARKNRRYMPLQIATSSDPQTLAATNVVTPTTTQTTRSKPIHWLCRKVTPMFKGQDFFVEYRRRAFSTDIVSDSTNMLPGYQTLDSKIPIQNGTSHLT